MSIKFDVVLVRAPTVKKSDNWQDISYQWQATINGQNFDYYTGKGLIQGIKGYEKPKKPTLDDVLYSLILDVSACDMPFDDWCSNYGYETDSRKALEIYLACQDNAKKLRQAGINIQAERERLQDY